MSTIKKNGSEGTIKNNTQVIETVKNVPNSNMGKGEISEMNNPVGSEMLITNKMELQCKYLIDSTKDWPSELFLGCLQLEVFVEKLEGVEITNSLSDFQPSYELCKIEGDRIFTMMINPRIHKGKLVYCVRVDGNKIRNLWDSAPEGTTSINIDFRELGSTLNPYIWDAETLANKIENIDMAQGHLIKKAS